LLAKPTPRNVNLGSVRFAMFNNQRDIFKQHIRKDYGAKGPFKLSDSDMRG